MLPIRDVIPSRTTPWVVIALLAAYATASAATLIDHPGWLAVPANLVALAVFGETLEDRLGHGRFLAFGLLGAAAAVAGWMWLAPAAPYAIAAATGGVACVLGGYLSLFPRSRVLVFVFIDVVELPALIVVAFWAVLHAVALDPLEAARLGRSLFAAQVIGLGVGAASVRLFRRRERFAPTWWS
jgi:membrane associated rhomboid family serine protease